MTTKTLAAYDGWTFDPSREVWFARTAENRWIETAGTLDDPPHRTPAAYAAWAETAPPWVRTCRHGIRP